MMGKAGRTVAGADHAKPLAGKICFDDLGDLGFVLNDQDQGIGHDLAFGVGSADRRPTFARPVARLTKT